MSSMANPMDALISLQQALNDGVPVDLRELDSGYHLIYDEPNGGRRFSYPKIIRGDVQALAIFGLVEPINGVTCFSVGYAVHEKYRGRNLAVEAVNRGIDELKRGFGRTRMQSFYVEAVIDETNAYSISVAKKLFSGSGKPMNDSYSGTPSLYFSRLVAVR